MSCVMFVAAQNDIGFFIEWCCTKQTTENKLLKIVFLLKHGLFIDM